MKFGVRKPSFKKSIKARTTGRINRAVKRTVNPLYGKKGVGFVKDPSRSIKNAVYQRTTFSVFGHGGSSKKAPSSSTSNMGFGCAPAEKEKKAAKAYSNKLECSGDWGAMVFCCCIPVCRIWRWKYNSYRISNCICLDAVSGFPY